MKLAQYLKESGSIPEGIINIVTGGPATGKALLAHPGISIYSFTGSTEVGRIVQTAAANHPGGPKPVILELGGKSPNIVFPDVNIDNAVKGALFGIMVNQGEVCSAGSRILVHRSIYNEFVDKMAEMTKNITMGPGKKDGVKMGPLISKEHTEEVLKHIEEAKRSGARLVTGGGRPSDPALAKGNYILPTIFADVDPDSKLAQQEVFGPVAAVIPFDTEEEAIAIANNTQYGLAASIWTRDDARASRVADQVDAGVIWINASQPAYAEIPWGGMKASGFGKDKMESYMTEKTIYKHATPDEYIDWYPAVTPKKTRAGKK
jgi:acyl-CoA reductase-like NAD-dependent aldehyde dehydrogenase